MGINFVGIAKVYGEMSALAARLEQLSLGIPGDVRGMGDVAKHALEDDAFERFREMVPESLRAELPIKYEGRNYSINDFQHLCRGYASRARPEKARDNKSSGVQA